MTRPFAIITVGLVAATWGVYLLVQGVDLAWSFLGPFSAAVGVLTAAGFGFKHWAWHWPGLHLLTRVPRLSGSWAGTMQSNYVHAGESEPRGPIDVIVVISQNADRITIRQYTSESASITVASSAYDEDGDRFVVATVYRNEPPVHLQQTRSPMHYGATRLAVEGPARHPRRLVGDYWTMRNTAGTLDLKFVSRRQVHSFREGIEMHEALRSNKALQQSAGDAGRS